MDKRTRTLSGDAHRPRNHRAGGSLEAVPPARRAPEPGRPGQEWGVENGGGDARESVRAARAFIERMAKDLPGAHLSRAAYLLAQDECEPGPVAKKVPPLLTRPGRSLGLEPRRAPSVRSRSVEVGDRAAPRALPGDARATPSCAPRDVPDALPCAGGIPAWVSASSSGALDADQASAHTKLVLDVVSSALSVVLSGRLPANNPLAGVEPVMAEDLRLITTGATPDLIARAVARIPMSPPPPARMTSCPGIAVDRIAGVCIDQTVVSPAALKKPAPKSPEVYGPVKPAPPSVEFDPRRQLRRSGRRMDA